MQNRDFIFEFEERPSDSPYVDVVWRTDSQGIGGEFISIAESRWGMVITREQGGITITVMGAETQASIAAIPENADFMGITFRHGVFMPHLTPLELADNPIHLPPATTRSFWLGGASWQIPTYENVDVFVNQLIREGILCYDPVVGAVLGGDVPKLSARSVQRRFLRATGLTYGTWYQI
nr:AraC family transcriptional regulator [Anaerolineae bacterium]